MKIRATKVEQFAIEGFVEPRDVGGWVTHGTKQHLVGYECVGIGVEIDPCPFCEERLVLVSRCAVSEELTFRDGASLAAGKDGGT